MYANVFKGAPMGNDNAAKDHHHSGGGDGTGAGGGSTTPAKPRPISTIARDIRKTWGTKVNYAAKPYLDAMHSLETIDQNYYEDSAKSVVAYFLSNASSFRGPDAKRLKQELKTIAGIK